MTVDEFVDILRDSGARVVHAVFYPWDTPLGYRAEFEWHNCWCWYSVSLALQAVSPGEVAAAVTSPTRRIERCEADKNGHGFKATVWAGNRCYRMGMSIGRSERSQRRRRERRGPRSSAA
jgi:hypothetical protein